MTWIKLAENYFVVEGSIQSVKFMKDDVEIGLVSGRTFVISKTSFAAAAKELGLTALKNKEE